MHIPNRILFSCFAFCLTVLIGISTGNSQDRSAQTDDVVGFWTGALDIQGTKLQLELNIEKNSKGELDGAMVSVSQGGVKLPFSSVTYANGELNFAIQMVAAKYIGKMSDDGKTISGTFSQGLDIPLKFTRSKKTDTAKHIETWRGVMKAGGAEFDFQLRVFKDEGKLSGKLDSFSENLLNLDVTIEQTAKGFNFELPATKARYEGIYSDDKSVVTGKWIQGGGEYDLVFEQKSLANTETAPPEKPQTPQTPFPYDSTEVKFKNGKESVVLAGTLTTPKTGGPHPVVILISGSGAQDRDESLLGHKPFLVLSDYLTRRGIAVLRYDDRGYGQSTGDFRSATSENFATDVEAAVAFAANHEKLDKNNIGLVGHSEGGMIAPMVASRNAQVAFIVLLAGPGVTGAEIIKKQTHEGSKLVGISEAALTAQDELITSYLDALLTVDGKIDPETSIAMVDKYKQAVAGGSDVEKALAVQMEAVLGALDTPWTRFFIKYDPKTDLRKVKCPVLAINGAKDVQVDADINLGAIQQALTDARNQDFDIKKLDNLNHLFQNATTGAGSEYAMIKETFAPSALKVIGDWIESHVK